jgi:hypothetical protein
MELLIQELIPLNFVSVLLNNSRQLDEYIATLKQNIKSIGILEKVRHKLSSSMSTMGISIMCAK